MAQMKQWQFWIDRGGTFTDVVARSDDGTFITDKLLSHDPSRYDDAAVEGIRRMLRVPAGQRLPTSRIESVRVGTTVATNALLERKGSPVVLVTTEGFADATRIGHQARPDIFARRIDIPTPLHELVIEAPERLAASGDIIKPLDTDAVTTKLRHAHESGFDSVAISLMHAYRNPVHERTIADIAQHIGFGQICVSHDVTRLIKLIPRTDTTVVDAYLSPLLRRYMATLQEALPGVPILFMRSSGGLAQADSFRGKDAILSGPAGGIVGAARTAEAVGISKVIGFDMGGTSTDVCRFAGEFERNFETQIAGVRLRVPMLGIHTVAAGGGSILHFDGTRYRVGPDSAGADPGPTAYGRGGPLSVTDANVMLGRIQPDFFPHVFGPNGDQGIDVAAVRAAFAELNDRIGDGRTPEQVAEGFLRIAVANMADAIRKASIQKGHDVTDYALSTFGGAGAQHACAVANALGMTRVFIHSFAGTLSAYGMGLADVTATGEQAVEVPLDAEQIATLRNVSDALAAEARAQLRGRDIDTTQLTTIERAHLKYAGTDTALIVPLDSIEAMRTAFEAEYRSRFSFLMGDRDLIVEAVSVEVVAPSAVTERQASPVGGGAVEAQPVGTVPMYHDGWTDVALFRLAQLEPGHQVAGPAIIVGEGSTIVVDPGWHAHVTTGTHLMLEQVQAPAVARGTTRVDPVMLELFNNIFMSIAEQMGHRLQASANSVNIKERLDFSCALFDRYGNLIANAPHIPVHLGSMGESIKAVIDTHGDTMRPGDSFMLNNPYAGGTHLPDITVVTPVFDRDGARLRFFVASRGHHAEIGGIAPGSMPADSTRIDEEGVLIDSQRIAGDGKLWEREARRTLGEAPYPSRNPDNNIADLRAQLAANTHGAANLQALVDQYGFGVVDAYMGHVRANARRAIEKVLASARDGQYRYRTDAGATIAVSIRVDRSARRAHIDFTGTSPQQPGNTNAPSSVAMAAVLYVLRTLVDDAIPLNSGCLEPVTVTIPPGSMLSPQYPAAVVAGNVETSQAIVGALYGALKVQAEGSGTMNNLIFGNARQQYYETVASGSGAGDGFCGTDVVQTHMTNSRLTDPEVLELRHDVRLEEFSIRSGSGGGGRWRGGHGAVRRLKFLAPMTVTILSGHRRVAPYGMAGGNDGGHGKQWVERADGRREDVSGCDTVEVAVGDVFVLHTPGGGGYGMMARDVAHESSTHG